jgi:hypothetical protein
VLEDCYALTGWRQRRLARRRGREADPLADRFRSTIPSVEVLRSALRHGVRPEDIQHVLRNALVVEEINEDPTRYLVLGADQAGKLLELVVMDRPQGPAVMHAMAMRAKYRILLPKGW